MHNNYYFLRLLSRQLNEELSGFTIEQIFSQQKNELVIVTSKKGIERYIRAYLSPEFCCLSFPESFQRARRNSVDLFPSIFGLQIEEVVQIDQDRSFYMRLGDGSSLLFKMHGNRSNVVQLQGDEVVDVFKSNLKQDLHVTLESLAGNAVTDKRSFDEYDANYKALIPTLGKTFDAYFDQKQFYNADMDRRYELFCKLLHYLEDPPIYLSQTPSGMPKLSLYKITDQDISMNDPVAALNKFYKEYITSYALERAKKQAVNQASHQIRKCDSYILKSSSKLQKLESALNYRHLADLIMANLHAVEPYASSMVVTDFYSNEPVKIKLNATLTAQLNAERYYRKAKKQQLEINSLQGNIDSKQKQKQKLQEELLSIQSATDLSSFKKSKKPEQARPDVPYHTVYFMNYEILVGKNAAKNEKLTFHFAKKDDLFLHAKDTSGSHVIVKKKTNQNFPKQVIELAASLAAHYSKSKSESLCRVLFTPRKFVRKVKGGPPGAVLVDKEQIILVPPKSLQEI